MKTVLGFCLLLAFLSISVACSGGGGGGGGAEPRLTQLTGKDTGQILANIGGAAASAAPNFSGSSSILALGLQPYSTVSVPGFTNNGSGTWVGTPVNGVIPSLQFYNNSDQFVNTTTDSASFASVAKIKVLVDINKTFVGAYTLSAKVESALAAFDPMNPSNFPASLTFALISGTKGSLSGDFGSLEISSMTFTANNSGRIIGTGAYQIVGTVKTDAGEGTFNAEVSFNNGGCQGATLREGDTVGAGTQFGTAVLGAQGLVFTINGEEHTVTRVISSEGGGCTLDNINFSKYGAVSSGQSLASVKATIGCAHVVESTAADQTFTARWFLTGYEGVYIEVNFDSSGMSGGQSIVGINSENGMPKCINAPTYPNCSGL
jgi:hypothetical protein